MAVLPPTEESTAARSVVGSCTSPIPRMYSAAARPAMSPVTPPPRANTVSVRVRRSRARKFKSSVKVAAFLLASPAGKTNLTTRNPALSRDAFTAGAYSGSTLESVTSAAVPLFPSVRAYSPVSRRIPFPKNTS